MEDLQQLRFPIGKFERPSQLPLNDEARAALAARGVASAIHYPLAITQQPAYLHLGGPPCPRAEAWAASCLSLPCFPELTDDEVALVASALEALAA